MSELREECYQCLNKQNCIADYKSLYCTMSRKSNFKNIDYANGKDKQVKRTIVYNSLNKLVTIEFSNNINNPNTAIVGAIENNKKVVNIYKVNRVKYDSKLKTREVLRNINELNELTKNSELIGKLVFNHDESIESLMYILTEMYKVKERKS